MPTTGGNADGAPCHFPFMYRGQSYDACITANNEGVLWCATVPIYDINKIWGNCGSRSKHIALRRIYTTPEISSEHPSLSSDAIKTSELVFGIYTDPSPCPRLLPRTSVSELVATCRVCVMYMFHPLYQYGRSLWHFYQHILCWSAGSMILLWLSK